MCLTLSILACMSVLYIDFIRVTNNVLNCSGETSVFLLAQNVFLVKFNTSYFFSTFFRFLFYSYFPGVDQQYFPASYHHPEIIANRVSNLSKRLQQVDCSSLTSVNVRHYFHSLSQLSRAYTTVSNNKSIISYGGCCCYC